MTALTTGRGRRTGWALAAGAALLLSGACEPVPTTPTTTTTSTSSTATTATTAAVSTTSTTGTTSTSTTSTTATTVVPTTTTTVPDGSGSGNDTGLTRVRVTIDTSAAWVNTTLHGVNMDVSRVVSTLGSARVTALGGDMVAVNGTGRAVIEAVLAVPDDAATSLSMCKNYHGPATVTVARLTDGETVVAALTNTGTSTAVPPESCENYLAGPMARTELLGPTRWPARLDPRRLVLSHYYPWYDAVSLTQTFGDQPTGPANTSDPGQVASAVQLAVESGIDGFVVEYEATPANDPRIDLVYSTADQRDDFEVALMLDFALLQVRGSGLDAAGLDAALNAVAARAGRPSQLQVGGQPVVFIYASWDVDPSQWSMALERLRNRTGLVPFVISDGAGMSHQARHDYATNNLADEAALQNWADYTRLDFRERPGLYGQNGPLYVAPVSPGYDDRRLGRAQSLYVDRRGGARYDEQWEAALATLPEWVVVTTWNEYFEQTHVMPGTTTGMTALEQTAAWSAQFHATG